MGMAAPVSDGDGPFGEQMRAVTAFKKIALMTMGTAMQKYGQKLTDEQEVLSWIADILIDTYAAESAVLRAAAAARGGEGTAELQADAARTYVNDAAARVEAAAKQALGATGEGDVLRTQLAALRRLLKVLPTNTVVSRRRIADAIVARGGYIFAT